MIKSKSSNQNGTSAPAGSHTIIGSGMILKGDLTSNTDIRIDGNIEGNIQTTGRIVVGNSGEIVGNLKGKSIEIQGKITGTVAAQESLTLKPSAVVNGDILTKKLTVDNAIINGKIDMGGLNTSQKEGTEKSKAT